MKYFVEWAGKTRVVEIATGKTGTVVTVDGVAHAVDLASVEGAGLHSLLLDDLSYAFAARFEGSTAVLAFHDREVHVPVEDERTRESSRLTGGAKRAAGTGQIKSVMPGIVKELRVTEPRSIVPFTRPPLPPTNMLALSLSLKLLSEMNGEAKVPPAASRMLRPLPRLFSNALPLMPVKLTAPESTLIWTPSPVLVLA